MIPLYATGVVIDPSPPQVTVDLDVLVRDDLLTFLKEESETRGATVLCEYARCCTTRGDPLMIFTWHPCAQTQPTSSTAWTHSRRMSHTCATERSLLPHHPGTHVNPSSWTHRPAPSALGLISTPLHSPGSVKTVNSG